MMYRALCLLACLVAGSPALAKLPPPMPEEQAATAQKKQQQDAQKKQQQEALEQVQDRIAESYRASHGRAAGASTGETERNALPKTTRETLGDAGPHGGRAPSAEAHSAPAR